MSYEEGAKLTLQIFLVIIAGIILAGAVYAWLARRRT